MTAEQQKDQRDLQNTRHPADPAEVAADRRADSDRSIVRDHRPGVTPRAVRPGRDISDGGDCD